MKNSIIICFALLISSFSFAQNEQYVKAMENNLAKLKTTKPLEGWQQIANTFDRIAAAEKDQWLPYYYSAYCHMILAASSEDQSSSETEAILDKAQAALDAAKGLEAENAEIHTLQGYIYTGRIWKSPMMRGGTYTPKAHGEFDKAIALEPSNPRPYYLKGQLIFYTPSFFGGGKDNAKISLQAAHDHFKVYEAPSNLHPMWGEGQNTWLLKECGVDLGENSGE